MANCGGSQGPRWWFPRAGNGGAITRWPTVVVPIAAPMREAWVGSHLALLPLLPWKAWFPKLPLYERVVEWRSDAQLFADSSSGHREWIPVAEEVRWAVFRLTKNA